MSQAPEYRITVEFGMKVLPPPKFILRRLPKGQGEIVGEYGTMYGEYEDLLANVHILGGVVEFEDASA